LEQTLTRTGFDKLNKKKEMGEDVTDIFKAMEFLKKKVEKQKVRAHVKLEEKDGTFLYMKFTKDAQTLFKLKFEVVKTKVPPSIWMSTKIMSKVSGKIKIRLKISSKF